MKEDSECVTKRRLDRTDAGQNRNRRVGKSRAVMLEQKLSPVLKPLFKIFKVSNLEDLLKRLLKLVFTLVLLIPLILLPVYFFFFTLLHV